MPLYFVIATDKPNAIETRLATRPDHLDYINTLGPRVKLGGPFLDKDRETPVGSILLIEAEDRGALDTILANDPYVKAGLFANVDVKEWRWVVHAPPAATHS
jgi:uncharacterized protein